MTNIRTIEGDFSATSATFALVVARFNSFIVDSLQAGAIDALVRHGVSEKTSRSSRCLVRSSCR